MIRVWWIWVLAFALPLQGVSATLMLGCNHRHPPVTLAHGHAHAHDQAHAQVPGHAHSTSAEPVSHSSHASSCSACAMCCLVLALPVRFTLPQVQVLAQSPESFIPTLIPTRSPDRLDRPPRSALA